jgi:hypothetical protein
VGFFCLVFCCSFAFFVFFVFLLLFSLCLSHEYFLHCHYYLLVLICLCLSWLCQAVLTPSERGSLNMADHTLLEARRGRPLSFPHPPLGLSILPPPHWNNSPLLPFPDLHEPSLPYLLGCRCWELAAGP